MEYMTRQELVRLFSVAREHSPSHHVAMLAGLQHGLRVSENARRHSPCKTALPCAGAQHLRSALAPITALQLERGARPGKRPHDANARLFGGESLVSSAPGR
jgi:hypothetical protein